MNLQVKYILIYQTYVINFANNDYDY